MAKLRNSVETNGESDVRVEEVESYNKNNCSQKVQKEFCKTCNYM